MVAFANTDINRPEPPASFRLFSLRVFHETDWLFTNRAGHRMLLLRGFISEALFLGH